MKYYGAFIKDSQGYVADLYAWDEFQQTVTQFNTRHGRQSFPGRCSGVQLQQGLLTFNGMGLPTVTREYAYQELCEINGRGLMHASNEHALVVGIKNAYPITFEFLSNLGIKFVEARQLDKPSAVPMHRQPTVPTTWPATTVPAVDPTLEDDVPF